MAKLKPGMQREITDLWRNGMPAIFIRKAYGISQSTLQAWLSSFGEAKRTGGGPLRLTAEVMDKVRVMREKGMTWDDVSDSIGFEKRYLQMRYAGKKR